MVEEPLTYFVKKAEELGIKESDLSTYVLLPDEHDTFDIIYFSKSRRFSDKKVNLRLTLSIPKDIDKNEFLGRIIEPSREYEFAILVAPQDDMCPTPKSFCNMQSFTVLNNVISKKELNKNKSLPVPEGLIVEGKDYKPSVDWILQTYLDLGR